MVVYDRDREDGPFTPREPHVISAPLVENGTAETEGTPSATEWDPIYEMFVSPNLHGLGGNEKALKNPVSHWRVSKKKITGKLGTVDNMPANQCQTLRSRPMSDILQ